MKFTIRDLLWLTVVVALALGWWLDHRRQVAKRYYRRFIYNQVELLAGSMPNASAPAPNPPSK